MHADVVLPAPLRRAYRRLVAAVGVFAAQTAAVLPAPLRRASRRRVAAVIGHCFSVWLLFGGGKGVATAFGAMAAVLPVVALISALVWITLLFVTRTPALGSLVAALLFLVLSRVEEQTMGIHLFTLSLFVIIVVRHIGNLKVIKKKITKDR